jgi:hypothetical protein
MTGVHIVHLPYRASFIPDLLTGQVTNEPNSSRCRDAVEGRAGGSPRTRTENRHRLRLCDPANAAVSSLIRIPPSELEYFPGARKFICESHAAHSGVMVVTGIEPAEYASSASAMRGFGRAIYPPERGSSSSINGSPIRGLEKLTY